MKRMIGIVLVCSGSAFGGTGWKDPVPPGAASVVVGDVRVDALDAGIFRVRVKRGADWTESGLNRYGVIPREEASVPAEWKRADGFASPAAEVAVDAAAGTVRFKSRVSQADLVIRPTFAGKGFRVDVPLAADERIYGLGDVSRDNLQRRGGRYEIWVKNVNSYIPIPVTFSTRGWGFFLNTTWRHTFDVGKADPNRMTCEAAAGEIDFYLFAGGGFRELLERYTRVTGRPALLPAFGYGFTFVCHTHIDMWALWHEATEFRNQDLPCDVLGLEPGWMSKNYDFTTKKYWDEAKFKFMPRWPQGNANFPAGLGRMGFKLSLWLCCDYDLYRYEEQLAAGRVREAGGKPFLPEGVPETWIDENITTAGKAANDKKQKFGKDLLVDAGRDLPEGEAPWFEHLKKFVQQGARCFKLDGCAQVTEHPRRKWINGMTDEEAHNLYPVVYGKQMARGFEEFTGKRAMVYSAGGYAGIQQFVASWAGDTGGGPKPCLSLVNLAASGSSNTSCDMDISSPQGLHFGFLQAWSQQCNWRSWNQPWTYDPEHRAVIRSYAQLRYRLLPYIYRAAVEAAETGWPIMRPIPYVWPENPAYDRCMTSYMFGDDLFVATYVKKAQLPPGIWHEWRSGRKVVGPCEIDCTPTDDWGGALYVRGGAVIPTWPKCLAVKAGWNRRVLFEVWPSADGTGELYEDDGDTLAYRKGCWSRVPLTLTKTPTGAKLEIGVRHGDRKANFSRPKPLEGAAVFHLEAAPKSVQIAGKPASGAWDEASKTFTVELGTVPNAGVCVEIFR